MKTLFFLTILFFLGVAGIRADETSDGDFASALEQVKNPFTIDLPKPVALPKPVVEVRHEAPKPVIVKPQVRRVHEEVVNLPNLRLEGVVVGEEIHQAIINDQVVALQEVIKGARVVAVSKNGVELLYKGKKFFLKIN